MSNKERGSYGNRYCTCNLCIGRLRWLHRRGGDSMNVGDLVRMTNATDCWVGKVGVIIKVPRTQWGMWAIRLTCGEKIATADPKKMEVINASR